MTRWVCDGCGLEHPDLAEPPADGCVFEWERRTIESCSLREQCVTMPDRHWPDTLATDELRLQLDFLQFLRQTAVGKVAGLTRALAAAAPLATSPRTTALGVIKHLTAAERYWISITAAGADLPSLWQGSPDPAWNLCDTDTPQ